MIYLFQSEQDGLTLRNPPHEDLRMSVCSNENKREGSQFLRIQPSLFAGRLISTLVSTSQRGAVTRLRERKASIGKIGSTAAAWTKIGVIRRLEDQGEFDR